MVSAASCSSRLRTNTVVVPFIWQNDCSIDKCSKNWVPMSLLLLHEYYDASVEQGIKTFEFREL
jgi:hypothetical protein